MTIEILISPTLSSPFQSVELHYYRCPCHYDDQRQHCSLKEDSIFEHRCIYSSAAKVQTHEQAVQSYSLSSRPQSMRITPPPTVLFDRVNGGKQKEYDSREDHDHHSTISCKKCVRFNLESSEVIPYLHCKDMTDEEIDASWFTCDEKRQFYREKNIAKKLIQHHQTIQGGPKLNMTNEKSRDDKFLETYHRGLEVRQQRLIRMSRYVVFKEQERQHAILKKQRCRCLQEASNTTKFVPEKEKLIQRGQKMIATRYRSITEDASILARQRARQDSTK